MNMRCNDVSVVNITPRRHVAEQLSVHESVNTFMQTVVNDVTLLSAHARKMTTATTLYIQNDVIVTSCSLQPV